MHTTLLPVYAPGTAGERFHPLVEEISPPLCMRGRGRVFLAQHETCWSLEFALQSGDLGCPAAGRQEGKGAGVSSRRADLDWENCK